MNGYIPSFVIEALYDDRLLELRGKHHTMVEAPLFRRPRPIHRLGELLIRLGSRLTGLPAPVPAT